MRSWHTTVSGAVLAICATVIVCKDTSKLSDPQVIAMYAVAYGLVKAADEQAPK